MPISSLPGNTVMLVISASPMMEGISALPMMTVRPSASNRAYSSLGFTHRATLLGRVQGVVVQA